MAPKRELDPSAIILFHHSDREICRILEQEHEHDSSTSAFTFKSLPLPLLPLLPSVQIFFRPSVIWTSKFFALLTPQCSSELAGTDCRIVAYTPVWRAGFIWDDAVVLTRLAQPPISGSSVIQFNLNSEIEDSSSNSLPRVRSID